MIDRFSTGIAAKLRTWQRRICAGKLSFAVRGGMPGASAAAREPDPTHRATASSSPVDYEENTSSGFTGVVADCNRWRWSRRIPR